jgi:hypothetical protein
VLASVDAVSYLPVSSQDRFAHKTVRAFSRRAHLPTTSYLPACVYAVRAALPQYALLGRGLNPAYRNLIDSDTISSFSPYPNRIG